MTSQGNLQIRRYRLFWQILQSRQEETPNYGGKKTLSKIAAPGPTFTCSFEVILSNKDEIRIGQLSVRSLNHAI